MNQEKKRYGLLPSALDNLPIRRIDWVEEHQINVAMYCGEWAKRCNLREDDTFYLVEAAKRHDLGKGALPEEIVNKPGRLTDKERKIMNIHSRISSRREIIRTGILRIGLIIDQHHERWDGKGYPRGLKGEEIDPLGQILGIVDFIEALKSANRPYRRNAFTESEVRLMLEEQENRMFYRGNVYFALANMDIFW